MRMAAQILWHFFWKMKREDLWHICWAQRHPNKYAIEEICGNSRFSKIEMKFQASTHICCAIIAYPFGILMSFYISMCLPLPSLIFFCVLLAHHYHQQQQQWMDGNLRWLVCGNKKRECKWVILQFVCVLVVAFVLWHLCVWGGWKWSGGELLLRRLRCPTGVAHISATNTHLGWPKMEIIGGKQTHWGHGIHINRQQLMSVMVGWLAVGTTVAGNNNI